MQSTRKEGWCDPTAVITAQPSNERGSIEQDGVTRQSEEMPPQRPLRDWR